jgi:hypothetical protein
LENESSERELTQNGDGGMEDSVEDSTSEFDPFTGIHNLSYPSSGRNTQLTYATRTANTRVRPLYSLQEAVHAMAIGAEEASDGYRTKWSEDQRSWAMAIEYFLDSTIWKNTFESFRSYYRNESLRTYKAALEKYLPQVEEVIESLSPKDLKLFEILKIELGQFSEESFD